MAFDPKAAYDLLQNQVLLTQVKLDTATAALQSTQKVVNDLQDRLNALKAAAAGLAALPEVAILLNPPPVPLV